MSLKPTREESFYTFNENGRIVDLIPPFDAVGGFIIGRSLDVVNH